MPTAIRCFAVLEGGNAGKIFTDDPDDPKWGYVCEADDGVLYLGGKQDKDVLRGVVSLLRQEGTVAIGFRDGDPSVDIFPPDPDAGAACQEFDRPVNGSDLSSYLNRLPQGYEVRRMDRLLMARSPFVDETIIRYGSIDNFVDKGLDVGILRGDEIVCEASVDMAIRGVREVGVVTEKAHRGLGLATVACAHLIKMCDEEGCLTYWDCAKLNLASSTLARKLGFRNERGYKLLAWFPPKDG
jgi:GNAT superfamily N-acetyltransferase